MLASKLNMSGLDFVAPVLQSSNRFHRNAFFQVLFSLIGSVNNIVYCEYNSNPSLSLVPLLYPTIYPLARSLCSLTGFLPVSLSLILLLGYASPVLPSSFSIMYIYSSASLSILPPYSLVVFVTLTKVKAVLA